MWVVPDVGLEMWDACLAPLEEEEQDVEVPVD